MKSFSLIASTIVVVMMTKGACGECISNCTDLEPGRYQSCHACNVYAVCDAGLRFFDDRPCPATLVFDDTAKRCQGFSTTCGTQLDNPGPDGTCVKTCDGLAPGNYQSCQGCSVYVTCAADGVMFDNRPCPATQVWDDKVKNCRGASSTCP